MTNTASQSHDPVADDLERRFQSLSGVDRAVAHVSMHPRWPVYAFVAVLAILGWMWLTIMAAGVGTYEPDGALGPGSSLLGAWLQSWGEWARSMPYLDALIRLCTPQVSALSPGAFFIAVAMWFLMSIAMMLPSAAPMLTTYADIADVARQKGESTLPVSILAAGYLAVWLGFSIAAAGLQSALTLAGFASSIGTPVVGLMAAFILLLAGLYQFSSLREACLDKCRNPFATLFGRWQETRWGVFRLGIEQGVFCLGCCWALMMVMLAVGTMNLIWMVLLALFAIAEKSGDGKVTSRVSGGILVAWSVLVAALSLT